MIRELKWSSVLMVALAALAPWNMLYQDAHRVLSIGPIVAISVGWVVPSTLFLWRIKILGRFLSQVRMFVVLFFATWVTFSLVTGTAARWGYGTDTGPVIEEVAVERAELVRTPSVYWIVLDEYGQDDVIEDLMGADVGWFVDDLEQRGFAVSDSSYGSYLYTRYSLPSTLYMQYPYLPENPGQLGNPNEFAADAMAGENPVVETFLRNGYEYVLSPDGFFDWSRCDRLIDGATCIDPYSPVLGQRMPSELLTVRTPVRKVRTPFWHNSPDRLLAGLQALPATDAPRFVTAHILSPHGPYRYEEDCAEREHWASAADLDGGSAEGYAIDVECVSRDVIGLVDGILELDPDAVIIIQGDHGPRSVFEHDQDQVQGLEPDEVRGGFGVLNAIRLPEECADLEVDGLALVNTFRLVLACLSDTEPDLLDHRAFVWDHYPADADVPGELPPSMFVESE